jgi:uncharacterized protein YjbJ (UPF0337 family)
MADDKAKGTGKQVEGKVEEGAGKLTGNKDLEAKGKGKQAEGKVQKKVGDAKDDLKDAI